jgi:hypothetical protein
MDFGDSADAGFLIGGDAFVQHFGNMPPVTMQVKVPQPIIPKFIGVAKYPDTYSLGKVGVDATVSGLPSDFTPTYVTGTKDPVLMAVPYDLV